MPLEIVIASLISAITSVLAGLYSAIISKKRKKVEEENKVIFVNKFKELWDKTYISDINNNYKDFYKYLLIQSKDVDTRNWRYILTHLTSEKTEKEIETEVKNRIEDIKNRVELIEKRFPKESTLEKIASVNDAILATNIETLTESLKSIEAKLLTKWDVAKIVFEIIAALGLIIGLVFAILQYFKA